MPPPATEEEVTRTIILQTVVRTVDFVRMYWKYECGVLAFLAVLLYMPKAGKKKAKKAKET